MNYRRAKVRSGRRNLATPTDHSSGASRAGRTLRLLPFVIALVWSLSLGSGVALADGIVRGYIVRIEDKEIYFDIAAKHGLDRGGALRIKRPIKLRHPVSGKQITDWLPIGRAQVTMVGSTLGMARLDDGLLAQVQVGDIVESLVLVAEAPEPAPRPTPQPNVTPEPIAFDPLPTVDEHTRTVLNLWQSTSGTSVEVRIGAWEDFLARFPDSPYAGSIHEDLEVLRAHRDKLNPPELDLEDTFTGGLLATTILRDAVAAWAQLFGLVSLELFGHFENSVEPDGVLFDHAVRALGNQLLTRNATDAI